MSSESKVKDYPTVNFKGDCGTAPDGVSPKSASSVSSTGMEPTHAATVNGSPVANCVIGNNGAAVFNVGLRKTSGVYGYQICVDAQGPSGAGSGCMHLAFTDASGDTYYLKVYSSSREEHTIDYNSKEPNITKMWWCDSDFTVPSAKEAKAAYRTTSPAHHHSAK